MIHPHNGRSCCRGLCASLASVVLATALFSTEALGQCEQAKLTASDSGPDDSFGSATALEGNLALVGSFLDDDGGLDAGSAYIYRRVNGLEWVQEQKIKAIAPVAGDMFGETVGLSGDVAVVGSRFANATGEAHVFRFDGLVWNHEQVIVSSDAANADQFATRVSVDSDVIVVGAPQADLPAKNAGAAYVFRFDGTSWIEEQKLVASDAGVRDRFGAAVVVQGDVAVVSAPREDSLGTNSGAVYVFRFDGTSWVEEQKLLGSDSIDLDRFGLSLDIDGDVIVAGTPQQDSGGAESGAAYVFRFDGTSWAEEQKLVASTPGAADSFAASEALSISGNTIVVGAPGDDDSGLDAGSAYVFRDDGTVWNEILHLFPSDVEAGDMSGASAAIDGGFVLMSSPGDDDIAANAGAGLVWLIGSDGDPLASWTNYGTGWPGTFGIPTLVPSAPPVLGTTINLDVGNSLGASTVGMMLFGFAPDAANTPLGGQILVMVAQVVPLALPPGGASLPTEVRCNINLLGLSVYLQVLESDAGASHGVSFSEGLQLDVGL